MKYNIKYSIDSYWYFMFCVSRKGIHNDSNYRSHWLIVWGACEIYSYITTTFFFRDAMWLASGILNILLGCLLCTMPVTITVSTFTFLFAFVLLVNGIQKITWGSRLSFFRVIDTKYLSFTGWVICC